MHVCPYWRLSGYYFFISPSSAHFRPTLGCISNPKFSAWDIGLLMSQMQLMRLFGPQFMGWLADRFGQRMLIIRLAGGISVVGFLAFLPR